MFYLINLSDMTLIYSLFISVFCLLSPNTTQQEIKTEDITLIASPEDKDICVIKVNEDYFLAHVSDIRLFNSRIMKFIELYLPDNDVFKRIKKEQPSLFKHIQAVAVIETTEGGKLPDKFVKQDKGKK